MRTWTAEVVGRWEEKKTFNVAAPTFLEAITKVKFAARKQEKWRRIRFVSLVQTAKLDA